MTLVEFLLNVLAEDEATACEAMGVTASFEGGDADWCPDWLHAGIRHLVRNCDVECPAHEEASGECGWPHRYAGTHIARHDPARVLAECEAKRQAIDVLTGAEPQSDAWHRGRQALQWLALPYADHPDYREEWKP